MSLYDSAYARSLVDPEGFWGEAAADVHWFRPYDRVLDNSRAPIFESTHAIELPRRRKPDERHRRRQLQFPNGSRKGNAVHVRQFHVNDGKIKSPAAFQE